MTRLSIIIPVHNGEAELPRCLASLVGQISGEDEILLVEDSSTDRSGELCDTYAAAHENIHAFHVNFKGPSPTRNYGIRQSKGKYILFVDCDDYLAEDTVAPMLEKMTRHQMVVTGYYFESGAAVTEKRFSGVSSLNRKDILALYQRELLNVLWNKMFVAAIIRDNRIAFDESLKKGEDLLFILQYLGHVQSDIAILDRCCYHYISKDTGINKSHKESMDDKRGRMERIMKEFSAVVEDRNALSRQMLNMYFRHIRDYSAGQSTLSRLRFIKGEARNPMVGEILTEAPGLFRFLHLLHMDCAMFVLNKLLLK